MYSVINLKGIISQNPKINLFAHLQFYIICFYFITVLLLSFPWYMVTDNVAIKSELINLGLKSIRASHQLRYLIINL